MPGMGGMGGGMGNMGGGMGGQGQSSGQTGGGNSSFITNLENNSRLESFKKDGFNVG
jgi:hypothetical protein